MSTLGCDDSADAGGDASSDDAGDSADAGWDASPEDAGNKSDGSVEDGGSKSDGSVEDGGSKPDAGGGDASVVDPGESAFSGKKDMTFGTKGVLDTGVEGAPIIGAHAVPGDKLLLFTGNPLVGTTSRRVYRFGFDGTLDTAYAGTGFATVAINDIGPRPFGGEPFTVDAMGRAYYVETSVMFDAEVSDQVSSVYIRRLGTNGMPDASFGTAGTFTLRPAMLTGLTVESVSAAAIEVLEDGSILLGGFVQTMQDDADGAGRQWAVIKLKENGSLDTGFNATGYVLIDSQRVDSIHLLHVADNGAIYAVGKKRDDMATFVALKIAADGTRDASYGTDGQAVLVTSDDSLINRIATDGEGRLLAVGRRKGAVLTAQAAYAIRLTATGQTDATFGEAGVVAIDFVAPPANGQIWDDMFNRILFEGDSIFLSGFTQSQISNQDELYAITRLAENGSRVADFPFNESLGNIFSVTYIGQISDYRVSGSSLQVLPTPDGKKLIGIGVNKMNKIEFVRWD